MALDVRQGKALAVEVAPAERWTTPVASLTDASGAELATPTVTLDAVDTTIATASSGYQLTLTSATGVAAGRSYQITHNGSTALATVDTIDGAAVILADPLPWTPATGATFQGVALSCTVPASATGTRGTHYALTFTDSADDSHEHREVLHVVRRAFLPPITSQDVRRLVTARWPADVLLEEQYREVCETVHAELRDELLATGTYAEAYIDPGPFKPAARVIARRILAVEHGLFPPRRDPDEYLISLDRERAQMLGRVLASIQPRDADDDGTPDTDAATMMAVRRSR